MHRLFLQNPNPEFVLSLLLKALKINVTNQTSKKCLTNHPDYPSLLSISDCLNEWKISNQAYQIPKAEYNAKDLEFPLIAHLSKKGGSFILIKEISDGVVYYSDEKTSKGTMEEESFLKNWNGIVLYATPSENSGEKNYWSAKTISILDQAKYPALLLLLLTIGWLALRQQTFNIQYLAIFVPKLIGIGVSILLLMYSIDANNPFLKNLCTLGKKNDCNTILKSESSKVTEWLTWSEVGFFYFTGSFLTLLFGNTTIGILAFLNLGCLPYTVYSIWYQYKVKNWCILCCSVQVLLWIETFTFSSLNDFTEYSFTYESLLYVVISFAVPVLAWLFLKPIFLNSSKLALVQHQLRKFKYNSTLFNQILTSQVRYSVPNDLMPLILGSPEPAVVITMVSNPFCAPCAAAHRILDTWLNSRDDLQVRIVFTTADDERDPRTKISRHLSALNQLQDSRVAEKALNDWYSNGNKNYTAWSNRFPTEMNQELNVVTQRQKEWCNMANISFTPTILVNGYKLPEAYSLDDIRYLLA